MVYIIYGESQYGIEEIDEFETMAEARHMMQEYRMAYGPGWRMWIKSKRGEV